MTHWQQQEFSQRTCTTQNQHRQYTFFELGPLWYFATSTGYQEVKFNDCILCCGSWKHPHAISSNTWMVLSIQPRTAFKYQRFCRLCKVGKHFGQYYDSTFISKTFNTHKFYNLLNDQVTRFAHTEKKPYQGSLRVLVPQVVPARKSNFSLF